MQSESFLLDVNKFYSKMLANLGKSVFF